MEELNELWGRYNEFKQRNLKLDMSRGKPCKEQLDISEGLLTALSHNEDCFGENGIDYRNYGLLDGIPEMKRIFADLLEVSENEIIVGGNSSLNMMYDSVARAMLFGVLGSEKPWSKYDRISFLCVVPGYDRHFSVTESFGINMICIPMLDDGPDVDMIEKFAAKDETVKGLWCVPKYSNPDGITYSDEKVRRLAAIKTAASDFRIFWDNAYALHDLDSEGDDLLNILEEAKKYGNEDKIYMFCSTSKVSYPGAGVSCMAASVNNIEFIKKQLFFQTIGPDKLNQLRHARYFKNADGLRAYMKKHAEIIKPRFEAVLTELENELTGIASWHSPRGGYFISLNVPSGCAKRTVALMKEAGVVLTGAGATFPYRNDPDDRNIRIAPTYPPIEELKTATELLCICVKIAVAEKKQGENK